MKKSNYAEIKYIYIYYFQQFEMIRSFGDNIYTGKVSIDEG